jgi:methyl-accepting chemotaxis protein
LIPNGRGDCISTETEHQMADTDARPAGQDELVADIDRTRAELARTIDAISDRVSPKRNLDRAMEDIRQRVNEASQRVSQQVNQASQRVSQQVNQASQRVSQQLSQAGQEVSQRVNQVDPVMAGAAAAAVLVGVTVLFLVRRRKR